MTKDEALQMCLEYIETNAHERKHVRHAIQAALAQSAQEPDDLRLHQWTATKKDLSDYICVGLLTLAGIEDGEYGQSEINSFENTIEALQERLVTGSEHKEFPLLAYIGGLNTTPPLPVQPVQESEILTIVYQSGYHDGKKAALAGREWNFCERCGKRTADLTVIHTCTPPQEKNNG